jgi:hypothetical protein
VTFSAKDSDKMTEIRCVTFYDMNNPRVREHEDAQHLVNWLETLGRPQLYAALSRKPTREHILHVIDLYMPYAQSRPEHREERGYVRHGVDLQRAEDLALRFRALIESWEPPDLTAEITEAARELLMADGTHQPVGGVWVWGDMHPPEEIENILMWPEGVPELIRRQKDPMYLATTADQKPRSTERACSWCGKTETEVKLKLAAGPVADICFDCARFVVEMFGYEVKPTPLVADDER